tara:strand:- start:4448 stop:5413 length:966 start_codon:yes stop_codon:yes gene_type:complete
MDDKSIQYHSANFPQFRRDKKEKFDREMAKTAVIFEDKKEWLGWLKNQPLKRSFSQNKQNLNTFHIHIPKTGGISIKNYVYGDTTHYNNFGHHSAWRLKEWFNLNKNKEEWDNYYKFAVVRNPWDILWSGYKYTKWGSKEIKAISKTPDLLEQFDNPLVMSLHEKVNDEAIRAQHKKNVSALRGMKNNNSVAKSFKEYVEAIYNSNKINPFSGRLIEVYDEKVGKKLFKNMPFTTFQFPYIIDLETEEIMVDHVGRFENLKETVYHLAEVTGDTNIIHNYNLSTKNISATEVHYKNMYDDDMINMVGKIYKEDIKRFNYDY